MNSDRQDAGDGQVRDAGTLPPSALATQKPAVALLGALHRHLPHHQPRSRSVQTKPRTCLSAVINGGEHGEGGPAGTCGCRLDFARRVARRGPARPNRTPQRAPRVAASRAAPLLAPWTRRRRAMLNRLVRGATGMKPSPNTHQRGVAICACVSSRLVASLEARAGTLLPTLSGSPVASSLGS